MDTGPIGNFVAEMHKIPVGRVRRPTECQCATVVCFHIFQQARTWRARKANPRLGRQTHEAKPGQTADRRSASIPYDS
jgi:hypothetical protein